jgi:hypothetical protein
LGFADDEVLEVLAGASGCYPLSLVELMRLEELEFSWFY